MPAQVFGEAAGAVGERRLETAGGARHNPQGLIEPFGTRDEPARAARRRRGGRCAGARPARTARPRRGPRRRSRSRARGRLGAPGSRARSTSSRSSRRRASSSSSTASAVSPANHSSPRSGSQPIPSSVTAGTFDASSSSRGSTGTSTSSRGSWPTSTSTEPSPADSRLRDQLQPARGVAGEHGRRAMAERRGGRALGARLDLEQLQCELLAFLGERACRRRQSLALRERLLERGQPLAREPHARLEILLLAHGGARGGVGVVGCAPSSAGDGPAGTRRGVGRARRAARPSSRCADSCRTPSRWVAPRSASSASRPPPVSCDSVSARRASTSSSSAASADWAVRSIAAMRAQRPSASTCEPRALGRRRLGRRRRVARGGLELDRRRRVVGAGRLELTRAATR